MIEKDINQFNNIFKLISKDWALVTAGKIDNFNTMTIGWATIGFLWGKNVLTCYVRPSRYTYKFMEENDVFTVTFFNDQYHDALNYLGSRSGRNENKVEKTNLTPIDINGSIGFKEASLIIICKKLYYQDFDETKINETIKNRYYPKQDYHRCYIGEIIQILENEI